MGRNPLGAKTVAVVVFSVVVTVDVVNTVTVDAGKKESTVMTAVEVTEIVSVILFCAVTTVSLNVVIYFVIVGMLGVTVVTGVDVIVQLVGEKHEVVVHVQVGTQSS